MLEIEHLTKRFGGNTAVNSVSTSIEKGKINAIIGPNGAGKTTFFNLISGVHKPSEGTITFEGRDITTLRTDEVARLVFGAESTTPEGVYLKASDAAAVKVVAKDVFDKFNVRAEDLVEAAAAKP